MESTDLNPDDVRAYLRENLSKSERKKGVSDEMGAAKTAFVEATGLNKTAVSWAERLNKLSPEVRGDVLRSLEKLREAMAPVWDQQTAMDFGQEADTPEAARARLKAARVSARRSKVEPEPLTNEEIQAAADATLETLEQAETGLDKTVEENAAIIAAGGRMRTVDEIAADVNKHVDEKTVALLATARQRRERKRAGGAEPAQDTWSEASGEDPAFLG